MGTRNNFLVGIPSSPVLQSQKRQLRRLSRKYRRIRSDVQPLIEQLEAGETPGDQIQSSPISTMPR